MTGREILSTRTISADSLALLVKVLGIKYTLSPLDFGALNMLKPTLIEKSVCVVIGLEYQAHILGFEIS